MTAKVTLIPAFEDNYIYLIQADNGETALVDPGDSAPVIAELTRRDIGLDYILITHHHGDHIGGALALKEKYGAQIVGSALDEKRIAGMDIKLYEGDHLTFGGEEIEIIETSGHTIGHICYYFPQSGIIFTGDTIFSLGCGRLFEGTPAQMWCSFQKILALPDETKLYCAHEYTLHNAGFALTIEPQNKALQNYAQELEALRAQNRPTLPSTIGREKEMNVFLRAGTAEKFAEIREKRNHYYKG